MVNGIKYFALVNEHSENPLLTFQTAIYVGKGDK